MPEVFAPKATVVADSIQPNNCRLTTILVDIWKPILAELNTHRQLSKSAASSRAIPTPRMIKKVKERPFVPVKWWKNKGGMSPDTAVEDQAELDYLYQVWLTSLAESVASAELMFLEELKVAKQQVNRLLEPYTVVPVLITSTEWDNFLKLRAHPAAQFELQQSAYAILEALNNSTPTRLTPGMWHLPFSDNLIDDPDWQEYLLTKAPKTREDVLELLKQVSIARCARTSYARFDHEQTFDDDLKLFNTLLSQGHFSPFEHVATPMTQVQYTQARGNSRFNPVSGLIESEEGWLGNIRGWIQYRKFLPNEQGSYPDLIKHTF